MSKVKDTAGPISRAPTDGGWATARRRMTGPQRRETIIRATIQVVARAGFGDATTRAIAKAAGITEAMVFRHFPTKEALFDAVIHRRAAAASTRVSLAKLDRLAEQEDDQGVIDHVVKRTLESYQEDPDFHRMAVYAALERGQDADRRSWRRAAPAFGALEKYVRKRQSAGAFSQHDADVIALAILALPGYYILVRRLFGYEPVRKSDAAVSKMFTDLLLRGIMTRDERGHRRAEVAGKKRTRVSIRATSKRAGRTKVS